MFDGMLGHAEASTRQPHRSQEQQTVQGRRVERGKKKQGEEEKGVGEKRKKEEREDGKEERRGTEGERVVTKEGKENEVEKNVTGWTLVTRKHRRRTVQIFVKVDGSKVTPMEVSLTDDKVEDVMRRIQKDEDACVTMQGKVLRTSENWKSCGVTDGCTIQVTSTMRGGGNTKTRRVRERRSRSRNWTTGSVRWRASK